MNSQAVAEARTLVESGMSANKAAKMVGDKYGVAPTTIKRWAKQDQEPLGMVAQAGAAHARACARAERLRHIEEGLALAAEVFPRLVRQAGESGGREADGFMRAARGAFEMVRLSEGEATSRVEHLGRDEFAAEVARLAAEMDTLPTEG